MNVAHRKALSMSWSKSPRRYIENMEAPEIILFKKNKALISPPDLFVHGAPYKVPIGSIVAGVESRVPLTIPVGGSPASNLQ